MDSIHIGLWIGFFVAIIVMLALDLGVFRKKSHEISVKEALVWSGIWIGLALIFNAFIFYFLGSKEGTEFLTAYILEKALSVDNLFVFIMIFGFFKIPRHLQHKVLFWGIIGALIMRAIFIFAGVKVIEKFDFILPLFGIFLIYTGIKMVTQKHEDEKSLDESFGMKMIKKYIPYTDKIDSGNFFTIENGKKIATPLFIALIMIELSDLVFAVDSIPAVFGVSQDMFIIYTSNIFAILGLRSLYFALSGMITKFEYLKYGLAGVLSFVGIKMILLLDLTKFGIDYHGFHMKPQISLIVIITILTASVLASYVIPKK